MGYGTLTKDDWSAYSGAHIVGKSTTQIYSTRGMATDFDPKNVEFRESCDSADHPDSTGLILGLDVTGSMGGILNNTAQKLGFLMEQILDRKPVPGPQILCAAVGDVAAGDRAPLQVTQFESDIRIAKQLRELFFEGGGGGNSSESYPLVWYFAARHTKIDCFDKHGRKGFIFTFGDDGWPTKLTRDEIETVFGYRPETDIDVRELLNEVNRKYEVYHFCLEQGGSHRDSDVKRWRDLLGERAYSVKDYAKLPELIISILESASGKSMDDILKTWDKSTAMVVQQTLGNMASVKGGSGLVRF